MDAKGLIAASAVVFLAGCETSGGNTSATIAGIPVEAIKACSAAADNFWQAAPGSSTMKGAQTSASAMPEALQLQMLTGGNQATCTVTPIGQVSNVSPGWSY